MGDAWVRISGWDSVEGLGARTSDVGEGGRRRRSDGGTLPTTLCCGPRWLVIASSEDELLALSGEV